MNALLLLLLAPTPQAPPRGQAPPPRNPIGHSVPVTLSDGKVIGLNEAVFRVLQTLRKKNPGALTELDAHSIKAAVLQPEKVKGDAPPPPGRIDPVERDLLEELTSPASRRITVMLGGTSYAEMLILSPATGKARDILKETIYPLPNLEAEWLLGPAGLQTMVNDYKNFPARQARIVTFVQGKLARKWVESNSANGYKPLRGELTERNEFASMLGADAKLARTILYKAMQAVDKAENNRVPDSLYDWLQTTKS